jgi:hypothetical protein
MPSVTLWIFVLGALVIARPPGATAEPLPRLPRLVAMLFALALAILPAQAAVSQARLNTAVDAFQRGDCRRAIDSSLSAANTLPIRPEPFQLLAFCDARRGRTDLSIEMAERALARDPDNWEFQYSLALVRGAAGRDPRPAARRALQLNRRERLTRNAARNFRSSDVREWRRVARAAPLPFQ